MLQVFILSSCQFTSVLNNDFSSIESTVKWLTASNLDGRMTGTAGNLKVQNRLAQAFKDLGLETGFEEGYLHPYRQELNLPERQLFTLEVFSDGVLTKKAEYGADYLIAHYTESFTIEGEITLDTNNTTSIVGDSNKILVSEARSGIKTEGDQLVLIKTDVFKKSAQHSKGLVPRIQISPDFYDYLSSLEKVSLKIVAEMEIEEVEVSNVVGKLKGKDHEKALVISAHFDHVGMVGKKQIDGAIDNASGVALLLDIASKLVDYQKEHELGFDILFCGFNGEETGLHGSKAFVEAISGEYKEIVNINLDSIGVKGDDTLLIAHQGEKNPLVINLESYLHQQGYRVERIDNGISDHVSFAMKGWSALTLSSKEIDFIHTLEDTIEKLDLQLLETLSKDLFNYMITNGDELFNRMVITEETEEMKKMRKMSEAINKARGKLSLGEFMIIEVNGEKQRVNRNVYHFSDLDEFTLVFPNITLQYSFAMLI